MRSALYVMLLVGEHVSAPQGDAHVIKFAGLLTNQIFNANQVTNHQIFNEGLLVS